jgi:hypothetical protein
MKILNGWKEIAECLHRTPRSARRWERLGLPVRRISDSPRSQVVAFHEDIEEWIRQRNLVGCGTLDANAASFRATRLDTQKLIAQLRETRMEFRKRLAAIEHEIARDRASPQR